MKRLKSDIPSGAVEELVSEYKQEGGLIHYQTTECSLNGEVVGRRAYTQDGKLVLETTLKGGQKHGRRPGWTRPCQHFGPKTACRGGNFRRRLSDCYHYSPWAARPRRVRRLPFRLRALRTRSLRNRTCRRLHRPWFPIQLLGLCQHGTAPIPVGRERGLLRDRTA